MNRRILPEALAELREAATWYEEREEGLGLELVAEYRARLSYALRVSGAGSLAGTAPDGSEIRRIRFRRFHRYALLLAILDGVPTVLAIEHSSRRPGYWRSRLG